MVVCGARPVYDILDNDTSLDAVSSRIYRIPTLRIHIARILKFRHPLNDHPQLVAAVSFRAQRIVR